jgi:hypothetical protein
MSSHFLLDLDTAAPHVTWGEPNGALAGQTLVVPYSSEEEILAATVTLLDGRVLEANVSAGVITVALPNDTPNGTVTVHAIRELGNYAALTIPVVGVIVLTRDRPPGGRPWETTRRPPRVRQAKHDVVERETAVASCTTRISTRRRSHAIAASMSTSRTIARMTDDSASTARSPTTTRARVRSTDLQRVDVTATIERRDGDTIAALIALGLL